MSIYLQRLVPIQPRTSPLKFDHLVENFGVKYGIVSFNLDVGPGDEEAALPGSGTEETGGSDDVAHGAGPFFPSTISTQSSRRGAQVGLPVAPRLIHKFPPGGLIPRPFHPLKIKTIHVKAIRVQ